MGPMVNPGWCNHWRHTGGLGRNQQKRSWIDGENKKYKRNGNIFLCLFFLLMSCLEMRPWSYLLIWVDSRQKKRKNPFRTFVAGLMIGYQLRSQDPTHIWSMEIVCPVPCWTGIQNGNQVRVWDWLNKLCARVVLRTHPQNSFIYWLTSYFPPFSIVKIKRHMQNTGIEIHMSIVHGKWQVKKKTEESLGFFSISMMLVIS